LINLIVNARDAMANGGNLTLQTASADLNEKWLFRFPVRNRAVSGLF